MTTGKFVSTSRWALAVLVLAIGVGCSKPPNDAKITSDIQAKLAADSGLQDKQLSVESANGTVSISGNVDTQAERDAAAKYAAAEPGVKTVINNIQVAGQSVAQSDSMPAAQDS